MKSNKKNPIFSGVLKFSLIVGIMGFLMVSACSGENTKDAGNIEEATDPAGTTSGTGDDISTPEEDHTGMEEGMEGDAADTTSTSPATTIDTTKTRGTTE